MKILASIARWRWRRNLIAAAMTTGPRRQYLAKRSTLWRERELWLSGLGGAA